MSATPTLELLREALRRLPGVGPKSATRMAYHLLERDREGMRKLSQALSEAAERIGHCERCNNLCEEAACALCRSPHRDPALLCIVESPADLESLEQAGAFGGRYYVLMGRLSPLDGIGPEQLNLDRLERLLDEGTVREVILATNLTVEGETTAHYLAGRVRARNLKVSRIAYGVPLGGELEYTDRQTLARALTGRREA